MLRQIDDVVLMRPPLLKAARSPLSALARFPLSDT
jgi:hypothetical protein